MEVKERIIEESVELFRTQGIRHTTMDDIAKNIGISKRTIYENFKDKESLLIDAVYYVYNENKNFLIHTFNGSSNVIEAVIKLLQKSAEQSYKHEHIVFEEIKKYYPKVHKKILLCNESERQEHMKQVVLLGVSQGVFREDLNPEIIAYIFTRQSEGLFTLAKDKDFEKFSIHDVFKNMTITFIRGLCTHKGIEFLENMVN
jgi:AcrR family transcriptional regulator